MSLFKKPKKNIQRRIYTENDDDDDNDDPILLHRDNVSNGNEKKKTKDKSKTINRQKQTLLSFETEEEGEIFQVKKSSHSKKVMRMFEKERQRKRENKHEKDEIKVKEKTEIVTDDLVLVVNSSHKTNYPTTTSTLIKPTVKQPQLILNGRDALCAGKNDLTDEEDDDSDGELSKVHRFSKPDNFKKVLESGIIPDAAMIHAARKRRQRAREMGDFISIEDEQSHEDKGRLIRDDDNDGSDDERIDMDVNLALRDQEQRREQFLLAAQQESDQEINEWEDQQIKKGVTGAATLISSVVATDIIYNNDYNQSMNLIEQETIFMPQMNPNIIRTPQMIADKLREHLENVHESNRLNNNKYEKIEKDLNDVTLELNELKMKAPVAANRFKFYQELRGYITDLVECFDEKIELITNLEQRSLDLLSRKYEWFIERRRQDVRDQAEEITNQNQYNKNLTKLAREDEEKIRRAAEREGRRTRRRRAREVAGQLKHFDGMSSDEEISQQDLLNFDKEREQIELEVNEIFNDVVDDYSSITNILIKFEQWRETDINSYNEAYATLCLPKILSPLIRLNLIFWDPLNDSGDIEKFDWYRTLALYGLHDDETESSLINDPDINLIPIIIDKVIIPKLTQLVDRCWDPVSNSQTLRIIGIITRYIRKYPTLGPASSPLNNIFHAILHKMKQSLEHDVFIPITPKLIENKSPFFQRQFANGLKLLKNITSWQGLLNDNILKELALKSLLNRYLLTAIKFCPLLDAVTKVGLIYYILPRVWLQNNSSSELKMFTTTVLNLSQQLDKNNALHLESIETVTNILKTLQ